MIQVVPVPVPVRCPAVDLHIARPDQAIQADPCIQEIRPPVEIPFPRADHFQLLPAGGVQGLSLMEPVFPYELNESLSGHHRINVARG